MEGKERQWRKENRRKKREKEKKLNAKRWVDGGNQKKNEIKLRGQRERLNTLSLSTLVYHLA